MYATPFTREITASYVGLDIKSTMENAYKASAVTPKMNVLCEVNVRSTIIHLNAFAKMTRPWGICVIAASIFTKIMAHTVNVAKDTIYTLIEIAMWGHAMLTAAKMMESVHCRMKICHARV